jgi:transcriptional regulator
MPSTYYYTAVHVYGRIHVQGDAELERWLGVLTGRMESGVEDAWRLDEIEHSEVTRRLPAILGFELQIERMEGKFKLGQDEPKQDALAVAARLARSSDPRQRVLGELTRRYNADRPDPDPA